MTSLSLETLPDFYAANAGGFLIVTDYDGTLSPFVKDPMQAFPDAIAKRALLNIHQFFPGSIYVLTGREISVFDQLFGDNPFNVSGQHGLQVRFGGDYKTQPITADEKQYIQHLAEINAKLAGNGFRIETKSAAVALHWRELLSADPTKIQFINTTASALKESHSTSAHPGAQSFKALDGDMNVEIKLARVDKGRGIQEIVDCNMGKRHVLFLCDDLHGTDGDAVVALRRLTEERRLDSAIVVQVASNIKEPDGYSMGKPRSPDLVVKTPADLGLLLQHLYNASQRLQG